MVNSLEEDELSWMSVLGKEAEIQWGFQFTLFRLSASAGGCHDFVTWHVQGHQKLFKWFLVFYIKSEHFNWKFNAKSMTSTTKLGICNSENIFIGSISALPIFDEPWKWNKCSLFLGLQLRLLILFAVYYRSTRAVDKNHCALLRFCFPLYSFSYVLTNAQ